MDQGLERQMGCSPRLVLSQQDVLSIGEKKYKDPPILLRECRKGIANRSRFGRGFFALAKVKSGLGSKRSSPGNKLWQGASLCSKPASTPAWRASQNRAVTPQHIGRDAVSGRHESGKEFGTDRQKQVTARSRSQGTETVSWLSPLGIFSFPSEMRIHRVGVQLSTFISWNSR